MFEIQNSTLKVLFCYMLGTEHIFCFLTAFQVSGKEMSCINFKDRDLKESFVGAERQFGYEPVYNIRSITLPTNTWKPAHLMRVT